MPLSNQEGLCHLIASPLSVSQGSLSHTLASENRRYLHYIPFLRNFMHFILFSVYLSRMRSCMLW